MKHAVPSSLLPAQRALLVVLAAVAAAAFMATPWLIRPYTGTAPWYESTAMFPRVALAMVVLGALCELLRRAPAVEEETEELDASASRPVQVFAVAALFVAYALLVPVLGFLPSTALFTVAAGLVVGLGLRTALALALPLALVLWLVFVRLLQVAFGGWL